MTPTIHSDVQGMLERVHDALRVRDGGVEVLDADAIRSGLIDELAWTAVFGEGVVRREARWIIRAISAEMGVWPASIHDIYMAAGRNEYSNITTPAFNLRTMTFDLARTLFQAAKETDTKQFIVELARSEMGYSYQRPGEYSAVVLAAAVKEGWQGPVFLQGDHIQASAKAWSVNAEQEKSEMRALIRECIEAGLYNIDLDLSSLVDISLPTVDQQQEINYVNTVGFIQTVRDAEPCNITVSIGAEIGEVGKKNSTIEDLDAFMKGYRTHLNELQVETGSEVVGISKISIQTGTRHGGFVLPDGSIEEISVDFDTLARLSRAARDKYGLGGAVQHGASTLPESAFHRFVEANALEVHLATGFQNAIYDSDFFPKKLLESVYAYIDKELLDLRKEGETDQQFHYSARKQALGPFKKNIWNLPEENKRGILNEIKPRFKSIMKELAVAGESTFVDKLIDRVDVPIRREQSDQQLANVDLGDEGE